MTYLVCYSPHKDDSGAIELACQFARSDDDTVHALTVVPRGWETAVAGDTDRDFQQWAAQEGAASAAEALEVLGRHTDVESTATWVTGRSVPQAVLEQAAALEVSLVVVGSGENGPRGYVTVTSKTDRLLHSADVPVAIAPRGYRPAQGARVTRVTMGFRDDDASWTLLDLVAGICARVGARLRLVTFAVRPRTMVSSPLRGDESTVFDQWKSQARSGLAEAVEHLRSLGLTDTETLVAEGRSWGGAMDAVEWGREDVLVVGSSSTHKLAQVFLGSSAAKILRNSTIPVIVVP
jgi:nucleotide-binding universal stress UspA family protein